MIVALLSLAFASPRDALVGPDALPAWASPSGEVRVDTAWWTSFGDPGLVQVMESALASNRDLAAAVARARASRAQAATALAPLLPTVSFDASAQLAPTASRGFQFGGLPSFGDEEPPATYTTGQAAFTAGWDVDLFLRNQQALAASRHDAAASEGDRDAAVLAFATRVAEGYFDVITARLRVGLVEQQVQSTASLLEIVELRYQAGDASAVDVLQQRQTAASARSQLPLARANARALEHQLAVALSLPPSTVVPAVAEQLPDLPPVPDAGLPADLVLNRPDLVAAEERIDAASARHANAVRRLLPTVRLSGTAGWQFFYETETKTQTFWNAGAQVSVPLFGGLATQNGIRSTRSLEHAAVHAYTQLAANAVLEVENGLVLEASRRAQLEALDEQLAAAGSALQEAREQYVRGIGSYLALLTAQNTHYTAQLAHLDARRQLLSARVQLHDALGGTWASDTARSLGENR